VKNENERAVRILQAADDLFSELGFDGTSMRDIARRAGVNKALVFYYYDNKEALFETVVQRYYEGHQAALESAFDRGGSLGERLHRLIDAYVDFVNAHRGFPRLMQRRVAVGSAADIELVRRGIGPLLEWTERALDGVTPVEGPLAARHFFVTFSGAVINFFTYGAALGPSWTTAPMSQEGINERRAHLHWLVDAILERLQPGTFPG